VKEVEVLTKKRRKWLPGKWLLVISVLSFGLTMLFGMLSNLVAVSSSLIGCAVLVLVLMLVNIVFDTVGMAVAASSAKPIVDLVGKNVKGARQALKLVVNADKVSCFCCDVVGDICSILSGAAGAAITLFMIDSVPPAIRVFLAAIVSSFIAAASVFGKAVGKEYAINYSTGIVLFTGKVIASFTKKQ